MRKIERLFVVRNLLHLRSSGGLLGAEMVILELAKHSSCFNYNSIVGAIKNKSDSYPEFISQAKAKGMQTVVFECDGKIDFNCLKKIEEFIRHFNIEIIHSHGMKENLFSYFLKKNTPVIATNHLWKRSNLKSVVYSIVDGLVMRTFDYVVGVSEDIVHDMEKFGIKKAVKISNGINIERFSVQNSSKSFTLINKIAKIGMLSSLTPEKGHLISLAAIKQIIKSKLDVKLIIAGEGPTFPLISKYIKLNGLENQVCLIGRQEDIPKFFSEIDIFILPSFKEGLPIALLEAMASRKAVIATKVGEIPNVIKNRVNGLLISINDSNILSDYILELMNDETLRKELGDAAFNTVKDSFTSYEMTKRYCLIYDKIV
ncbi:MAG: glycosyltransferase family 4 protein [Trichloromonadaceae bacterium]